MDQIKWADHINVGIREFNEQHKILFGMLNSLILAIKGSKNQELIGTIFDGIIEYTLFHFDAEEVVMEEHGYSGLEEHRLEHLKLLEQFNSYKMKFISGSTPSETDLQIFLTDWFIDHILNMDKKFTPFLNSKGVK